MADELSDILVSPDTPVKRALRDMDSAGRRILFVAAEDRTLLGVVTDGDIRRWILAGKSLDESVSEVMNRDPVVLQEGYEPAEAEELMVARAIDSVPVVDASRRIVEALWWPEVFGGPCVTHGTIDVPVVIMAGGEGSRLSPFTKILPKPLVPVGDRTIAEHIIDRFVEYGASRFYLSVNYKAALIRAYFSDLPHDYDLRFVQEDEPLGTAGSLSLLRDELDRTFFVSNCDVLIDAEYDDILAFHRDGGYRITLVASMKQFVIPYGVCEIETGGALTRMIEKPEYDLLVSTGMYVLEPEVLADIPDGERLDITDVINEHVRLGHPVGVYPVSERSWMDMGQVEELQQMLDRFGVL